MAGKEIRWKATAWAVLAVLFLGWLAPILALPQGYWVRGESPMYDLYRALGVLEAWDCGIWDARMLPTFRREYGSPILGLYAPLYLWVSAGWIALVGSWKVGMTLGVVTWLATGCAGMFLAARRIWRQVTGSADVAFWAGTVATIGWMVSAYPITNLYVRSDGPEFAAACLVPGMFWAVWRLLGPDAPAGRKCASRVVWLGAIIAGMVLSHNVFAMVALGLATLLPLGLCLTPQRQADGHWRFTRPRNLLWYVLSVILGLGLSAFFWVPALVEMHYTQVFSLFSGQGVWASGYLNLEALLAVDEWWNPSSRPGCPAARHLGWIILPAAWSVLAATLAIMRSKRPGVRAVGVAAIVLSLATIASLWFVMRSSAVFWENVPMGRIVQFPWRLLAVSTTLVCLVLPAAAALRWTGRSEAPGERSAGTGVVVVVFLALLVFSVQRSMQRYLDPKVAPMPDPQRLWSSWILTAGLDEYATVWQTRAKVPSVRGGTVTPDPQLRFERRQGKFSKLRLVVVNEAPEPRGMDVAYTYFPGWTAEIESAKAAAVAPLQIGPAPDGTIRISMIPPGTHTIRLSFANTPIRLTCKRISLLSLLLSAGLLILGRRGQHGQAQEKGSKHIIEEPGNSRSATSPAGKYALTPL